MKIDRIYSTNIDKIYNNKINKVEEVKKTNSDAIEISKTAKKLSAIQNEDYVDLDKKVSIIKEKVDGGTYYIDTKQLVSRLNEIMKGREV